MLDDVMVRRLKDDIREVQGGFPKRTVEQVTNDGLSSDAPELRLSRLLDQYRGLREQRLAAESKRKQAAAGRDIQELLPLLQTRGEDYAVDAAKTAGVRQSGVQRHARHSRYAEEAHRSDCVQVREDRLTPTVV